MYYYKKNYENDLLDDKIDASFRIDNILYVKSDFEFCSPWEAITAEEWQAIENSLLTAPEITEFSPQPTPQDIINAEMLLQQAEILIAIESLKMPLEGVTQNG